MAKKEIDYDAILRMFCAKEGYTTRFRLTTPFMKNGWTAATNGHISCMIPSDVYSNTDYETHEVPNVAAPYEKAKPLTRPIRMTVAKLLDEKRSNFQKYWTMICDLDEFYLAHSLDDLDTRNEYLTPDLPEPWELLNVNFQGKTTFNGAYLHLIAKACEMAGGKVVTITSLHETEQMVVKAANMIFCLMPVRNTADQRRRLRKRI